MISIVDRAGKAAQAALETAEKLNLNPQQWRDHMARAVLQAIRDPSEVMASAYYLACVEDAAMDPINAERAFSAMIDAALSE